MCPSSVRRPTSRASLPTRAGRSRPPEGARHPRRTRRERAVRQPSAHPERVAGRCRLRAPDCVRQRGRAAARSRDCAAEGSCHPACARCELAPNRSTVPDREPDSRVHGSVARDRARVVQRARDRCRRAAVALERATYRASMARCSCSPSRSRSSRRSCSGSSRC